MYLQPHLQIEELKTWNPGWTTIYDNRPTGEVLVILVQCKYSAVPPMYNTTIEETKNFVLTPDGTKCLHMMKADNIEK